MQILALSWHEIQTSERTGLAAQTSFPSFMHLHLCIIFHDMITTATYSVLWFFSQSAGRDDNFIVETMENGQWKCL